MRQASMLAAALCVGLAAGYLLGTSPRVRHAPADYDRLSVTFPDASGHRVSHTLAVVATFPVDEIDSRVVRPDDWVVRHFDANDPQGGTITYARPVRPTP